MTWEELTEILISFGERVYVVHGDGLDAVSLQVGAGGVVHRHEGHGPSQHGRL